MSSLFGITGLKIKTFDYCCVNSHDKQVNEFLSLHNGNICNIIYSDKTVVIVYKED